MHDERVLAFDYGRRRIGVAVGQSVTGTASAVTTLMTTGPELEAALRKLIAEWRPDTVVVGLPLNDDGCGGELDSEIREFANRLAAIADRPVALVDERLSSVEAHERLVAGRRAGRRRIRKTDIDAEAARVIAERWLREPDSFARLCAAHGPSSE